MPFEVAQEEQLSDEESKNAMFFVNNQALFNDISQFASSSKGPLETSCFSPKESQSILRMIAMMQ